MNIQSRSCTENRLCIFNECMCRTRGFCFVHVCIRTLPLSSPRFRNIRSRTLAAPPLSSFLAELWWCLEDTLCRRSNFNFVTTLDLTQQVLYDVRFSEIPFWFMFPFTLVINQNTYFLYFVTYPDNVDGHFRVVGKAWPEAQHSHFSSGTIFYFFKNNFDF